MWRELSSVHGPGRDVPAAARSYVAMVGEEAVGAATALVSTVHAPLRMLVVNVAPEQRRRGVGSALVAALSGDPSVGGGPFLARLPAGDSASLGFATRLGLSVVNRAFALDVDPASYEAAGWMKNVLAPADIGCDLYRSGEPAWPGTGAFVDFLHDGYCRSHERWAPCPGFPPERRRGFFLSAVEPGSPVVLTRGGEIVAAASLRRDETFGSEYLHLVFAYARSRGGEAADLVGVVVAECLRYAAARGARIAWELHETDTVQLGHAQRLGGRRLIDIVLCGPASGREPAPEGEAPQ